PPQPGAPRARRRAAPVRRDNRRSTQLELSRSVLIATESGSQTTANIALRTKSAGRDNRTYLGTRPYKDRSRPAGVGTPAELHRCIVQSARRASLRLPVNRPDRLPA